MSEKSNTNDFIIKVNNIHNNKYDYSKVNYIGNKIKIKIICKIHGEFEQIPTSHLKGRGCPYCGGKLKLNTNEFINKSNIVHNFKYDYSLVNYININTKVKIICPIHGEFEQTPTNHLHGAYGCIKCSGKEKIKNEDFINKAKLIHNDKYDYSKTKYVNSNTKIKIVCPIHGEFEQIPIWHLKLLGCPECSGFKTNKTAFINKSNIIHNNKYDYSKVEYIKNKSKVLIICSIHGEFKQTPHNHLHGSGCPKCNSSKGEIFVENFLNKNNFKYERQKKFDYCIGKKSKLPFDFYLIDYNLIIEFDGKQHYEPVNFYGCSNNDANKAYYDVKENDLIKNKFCLDNNISLIRIPYTIKNIDEYLKKELNNLKIE